jgi:hypothetical protein
VSSWSTDPDPDLQIHASDLDPDPAIFVLDLQNAIKKLSFLPKFFCLLLFEGTFTHLHHFSKIKSQKEVIKQ